jgi:two-component system cell cycle sensor histidine kinase/response regulator CckA
MTAAEPHEATTPNNPVRAAQRRPAETRREAALAAQFEALFDQAPVPMVIVGLDRTTLYNSAALELFGRDADEMARLAFQPGASWIPEDQIEVWADARRRIGAGERVTGSRMALLRPNGERREIEGSSIPIVTRDGAPGGVITVMTDLTDRLTLEAQLRHSQKMEALGRLAGGIAHDFNNVLTAILGYAELVADDARAGQVKQDDADQILAATARAIDLTARLTAFARREATRREPIDPAELIRAIMPLIRRLAPESIDIATHLEAGATVLLDRSDFEQALVNLVVNAADAMPTGGRLTIEARGVDLDSDYASTHLGEDVGRHALVAVSDTGTGMDDATRARIFEPFYTTKAVGQGTGLGLAMVFATVERSDGRIWVYSEPGHGTTFKIYLPLAEGVGQAVAARAPQSRGAPVGGTESILLLEDEEMVRDLVAKILRTLGYDITVATRPSEALALAAGRQFDLLLSDVVMPEMSGHDVARLLRETRPELPVVFMSGYTANALGFDLGPRDALVQKPMRAADLARVVRATLDARRP